MPITLADILTKYFPENAYLALASTIESYKFSFTVTKERKSKLGDFSVRKGQTPKITVNGTLNPYSFLITFLHELAHLAVYISHGRKIKPHGPEWKQQFQDFLLLSIKHQLFPDELLKEVLLFTTNPKASTAASPELMKALAQFDNNSTEKNTLYLDDIATDNIFIFRNQRYKKLEKRRTRVLCERLTDNRQYTISGHAEVTKE